MSTTYRVLIVSLLLVIVGCSSNNGDNGETAPGKAAVLSKAENALLTIEAFNNGDGVTPPPPAIDIYLAAGVIGVTSDNLEALNTAVLNQILGAADTLAEIQALVPNSKLVISGEPLQGRTLTVAVTDDNGLEDADITYQWKRNDVSISGSGATQSSYILTQDDLGAMISVSVSYTDDDGTAEAITSAAIGSVTNTISLSEIAGGTVGFVINGAVGDKNGNSVSNAGDVNGDGLDDLIIGAGNADGADGRSYVVFGKSDNDEINLTEVAAGTGGFVITGENDNDWLGKSVSAAGDVNGDGFADIIVGAPQWNRATTETGRAYVVFGKSNTDSVSASAIAAGNGGFVITGENHFDNQSGWSVSGAGDVNGDGLADLIVGAPNRDDPLAAGLRGRSYVIFGRAASTAEIDLAVVANNLAAGDGGFVINGGVSYQSGFSVSGAGDVNGDGLADLIIGSRKKDGDKGAGFVVFGKSDTNAIDLSNFSGPGFIINPEADSSRVGLTVSGAGDVNGDGLADLLIDSQDGRAYVVFGKVSDTAVSLDSLGTAGFALNRAVAGGALATSVSSAGDINGDGLADLIIGSPNSDAAAGRSYLVFGKQNNVTVDLNNVTTSNAGFEIIGASDADQSGFSVSNAGDVNGDGLGDLIIGAPESGSGIGRSYVVFGVLQATESVTLGSVANNVLTGDTASQTFIAGAADNTITGGGGADVMLGGSGDDIFILNASNVAALQGAFGNGDNVTRLARIDGGTGMDTLRLSDGVNLDLTTVNNVGAGTEDGWSRIESIEMIDLATDGNGNTVKIAVSDVIDMAGMNQFNSAPIAGNSWTGLANKEERHQIVVLGTESDIVKLVDGTSNGSSDWAKDSQPAGGPSGGTYAIWNHNTAAAQLLIDSSITVDTSQ